MDTVTLVNARRYTPDAIPASLLEWFQDEPVSFTLTWEGDSLRVTAHAEPAQVPDVLKRVETFFTCWRRTRQGRSPTPAPALDSSAYVDPADRSYVPPRPPRGGQRS